MRTVSVLKSKVASLEDIPEELLNRAAQDEFLDWLRRIPLTVSVQRLFLSIWTRFVGMSFTAEQIQSITDTAQREGPLSSETEPI